jgi:hypothetical protein
MAKLMIAEVYDAFKEAGVGEEKSRAAAEAVASYENRFTSLEQKLEARFTSLEQKFEARFAAIERKLAVLQWQMNVMIAGVAALILKSFFIS